MTQTLKPGDRVSSLDKGYGTFRGLISDGWGRSQVASVDWDDTSKERRIAPSKLTFIRSFDHDDDPVGSLEAGGTPPEDPIADVKKLLETERHQRAMVEQERDDLRAGAKATRKTEIYSDRIFDYVRQAIGPNPPVRFTRPAHTKQTQHVHDLFLSDWHYGETVDPEQVAGANEFNVEVLRRRVRHVYESILSFKETRSYGVGTLHVALGGDMASGGPGIHDEIRESNERVAAEQAVGVADLIVELLEPLVEEYDEIIVDGVSGNHPRMAKPHASKNVHDSFDWIAYKIVEARLHHYDNISFKFPRSGFVVQSIAGRNILLWHGDGIRSTMPGVPWGGVTRRTNELENAWAERGVPLFGFKVAHFHQPNVVQGGRIVMNGSLVGLNEYGLKQFGSGSAPCQILNTWDVKRGRLTDTSYITPQ